jgi:DNA-nicking Smr family endonuclease
MPALAPLVPLERRTLTALRRGRQPLEAVLDLHGLRQAEAHDRLRGFLLREQRRGVRLVLVITGKGASGLTPGGEERGVLKRMVPHWLRMADMRAVVLGFEDAALGHGGSGALYVRLRRQKDDGP